MVHKPVRLVLPAASLILLAISIFSLSWPLLAQSDRFWQLVLKLQIQADFRPTESGKPAGKYWLESDWCGFLEEDGLDFIIYHLGSVTGRWQLTIDTNEPVTLIPEPRLNLDYVEGREEKIVFYFSFQPEIIGRSEGSTFKGSIFLPSVPWVGSREKHPWFKRRIISGDRNLSLPRSQLTRNEICREFSWEEETTFPNLDLSSFKQRSRVRVILRLTRCQI